MIGKLRTIRKIIRNKRIDSGLFPKRSERELIIVMYHGIDKVQSTRYNERFFSVKNFEEQIKTMKRHFHVLNHADLVNRNFSKDKTNIVITFDDGYANNFRYALPVLDRYNAHAYFFITGMGQTDQNILWADALNIVTAHIHNGARLLLNDCEFDLKDGIFTDRAAGRDLNSYIKARGYDEKKELVTQLLRLYDLTKHEGLNDYWQLMTNSEIQRAAQSKNITIGSHGYFHNNLGDIPLEDALKEVALSKKYLESLTQKAVDSIAFPDGSYTTSLNDALYTAGVTTQFVVDHRYDDAGARPFVYDRYGLYPYMGNTNNIIHQMIS
jgi:peptidoglycan/xylan/chitin deacetylase (PgdA/CDA1 family)